MDAFSKSGELFLCTRNLRSLVLAEMTPHDLVTNQSQQRTLSLPLARLALQTILTNSSLCRSASSRERSSCTCPSRAWPTAFTIPSLMITMAVPPRALPPASTRRAASPSSSSALPGILEWFRGFVVERSSRRTLCRERMNN